MKFHPLAELFPLIEGEEFDALVADIKRHGQHERIVLFQNQILDGRNRYRACLAAEVEPRFANYNGADPLSFVVSLNLKRRHLSESQRAMVAAKLATLKLGDNQHSEGLPIGRSSELLNVGERSVARAREVVDRGATELQRAVEGGAISVTAAADIASRPAEEQREIVARGPKGILEAAKAIRAKQARERYAARVARIAGVNSGNTPLESDRRYPVIYADPPWDYQVYNETTGSARVAAEHYPTMKLSEICRLPVADIATDDAILFMWATAPHLRESFEVLTAWGFEYKTNAVWVKHAQGLGFFVRGQHEHLLIATRGDFPCPLPANRPSSVIEAPRREHSRKPDEAYEIIERMYPELPKVELFARGARAGWAAWGNEARAEAPEAKRSRPSNTVTDAGWHKWKLRFTQYEKGWIWNAGFGRLGMGSTEDTYFATRDEARADACREIMARNHVAEAKELIFRLKGKTECQLTAEDHEAIERAGMVAQAAGTVS